MCVCAFVCVCVCVFLRVHAYVCVGIDVTNEDSVLIATCTWRIL